MKKVLLLVSILCLSSGTLSQQKRINYLYYEMDAGTKDLIQIQLSNKLVARLYDSDNFQKYRDGKPDPQAAREQIAAVSPTYIAPPKNQHWFLVLDNEGQSFSVNKIVQILSLVQQVPANPPINKYVVLDDNGKSFFANGSVRIFSPGKELVAKTPQ
jgi:hypothetical protein